MQRNEPFDSLADHLRPKVSNLVNSIVTRLNPKTLNDMDLVLKTIALQCYIEGCIDIFNSENLDISNDTFDVDYVGKLRALLFPVSIELTSRIRRVKAKDTKEKGSSS